MCIVVVSCCVFVCLFVLYADLILFVCFLLVVCVVVLNVFFVFLGGVGVFIVALLLGVFVCVICL